MAPKQQFKTPKVPTNTAVAASGISLFPAVEDHDHGVSASSLPGAAAVTAASTKITLAGSPSTAALTAFSIDVAEANLTHNNLGGLTTGDPHTQYRLEAADHSHQSTGLQAGQLDHGLALTGLTDDDHTQYALLAGRSGGQTLIGGTAAGDDLILRATSGVGVGSEAIIFQLGSNGANEVLRATRANSQGQIGINTVTPVSPLHILNLSDAANAFTLQGDGVNANLKFDRYSADVSGAIFVGRKARGTLASPSQSLSGDSPLSFISYGTNNAGGEVPSLAAFSSLFTENTTTTAGGSAWEFLVVANGGLVQKRSLYLDQDASIQHHADGIFKMAGQNRFRHQENCVATYRTTNQSINDSTFTAISLDAEDFDTDGMHEAVTNPTRITINLTGKYFVTATAFWGGSATGLRFLVIRKNGGATDLLTAGMGGNASGVPQNVNGLLNLASGDYIEAFVWQNSGGALNLVASGTSLNFHANYIGE
ncbi:MAG: hypothetical protein WC773_04655 [Patescibacteria group bacterium]|jgi:hypothetical protein